MGPAQEMLSQALIKQETTDLFGAHSQVSSIDTPSSRTGAVFSRRSYRIDENEKPLMGRSAIILLRALVVRIG